MIDSNKIKQKIEGMQARQDEVAESLKELKGEVYSECLMEAANAYAVTLFSYQNIEDVNGAIQKAMTFALMGVIQHGIAKYATKANIEISDDMAKDFILDIQSTAKLMIFQGPAVDFE